MSIKFSSLSGSAFSQSISFSSFGESSQMKFSKDLLGKNINFVKQSYKKTAQSSKNDNNVRYAPSSTVQSAENHHTKNQEDSAEQFFGFLAQDPIVGSIKSIYTQMRQSRREKKNDQDGGGFFLFLVILYILYLVILPILLFVFIYLVFKVVQWRTKKARFNPFLNG